MFFEVGILSLSLPCVCYRFCFVNVPVKSANICWVFEKIFDLLNICHNYLKEPVYVNMKK